MGNPNPIPKTYTPETEEKVEVKEAIAVTDEIKIEISETKKENTHGKK